MNNEDYEQIMLQKDFINNVEFLKEGNNIDVLLVVRSSRASSW